MKTFKTNIINIYGDQGKVWLDDLPRIVDELAGKYGLSDLKPVENLTYHYVLEGFQGNQPIILKLGLDIEGLRRELVASKVFWGFGSVKVLAENSGLLLLDKAIPGISLKSYFPTKDCEAIQIACDVMTRLHRGYLLPVEGFPCINDWLAVLDKEWDIPTYYLEKAQKLRDKLLNTSSRLVLLHGDLHHDNILQNGDDWVVIDPKGVIGEQAYEVAAFIRNPFPEILALKDVESIIANRITKFATILGLDTQRISNWCFVQAVLSWVWALEDSCDGLIWADLTKIFDDLLVNMKINQ
ncbi:aminoglycoside phosphotransferase family protein [Candidatus Tisiphia endosymbiont of Ptychoptera albimana]|uniref:aminoglycoside phosphotransferase family protein n=1 Tax=unclassified Candidatus Tisiphia TaxID=2996318 RepID=UPI001DBB8673|nr:aminoglycoside phosphotransferase family protein [Rickettsia endosymbiont of Sericostoma sp. HW-2014]